MGMIERSFNGKIKICGIAESAFFKSLPLKLLEKEYKYYVNKISCFIEDKTVKILPYNWYDGCWSEFPLVNWIIRNHKQLGYEKIILEKTPQYYELKKVLKFDKYPDLLVYVNDEWLRLEVECWGHKYNYCHGNGYADLVYAYDDYLKSDSDAPIYTLKKHFGVKEIISSGEFLEFLYHYDEEFKQDYDYACSKDYSEYWMKKLGIKNVPQ